MFKFKKVLESYFKVITGKKDIFDVVKDFKDSGKSDFLSYIASLCKERKGTLEYFHEDFEDFIFDCLDDEFLVKTNAYLKVESASESDVIIKKDGCMFKKVLIANLFDLDDLISYIYNISQLKDEFTSITVKNCFFVSDYVKCNSSSTCCKLLDNSVFYDVYGKCDFELSKDDNFVLYYPLDDWASDLDFNFGHHIFKKLEKTNFIFNNKNIKDGVVLSIDTIGLGKFEIRYTRNGKICTHIAYDNDEVKDFIEMEKLTVLF